MEVPAQVLVHNAQIGMKGTHATLLRIAAEGYYELNAHFGEQRHRLLLPIAETALISSAPEEVFEAAVDEIER